MTQEHTVLVFGANGKVGSMLVAKLLREGFIVKAFVHGQSRLQNNPKLEILQGDIYERTSVEKALEGVDVVVSCLGSWGTKRKDVLTEGMQAIVPTMQKLNIRRIISLTGHDARAKGDRLSVLHRLSHMVLNIVAGKILRDGEEHIRILEASNLEWTVVRSPIMTNKQHSKYSIVPNRPFALAAIPRAAVVKAMLDRVARGDFKQQAIFIKKT